MKTPWFEETQKFRDNHWSWAIIILFATASIVPLAYGMYQQFVLGVPWGNKPMGNRELIFVTVPVVLASGIGIFILVSLTLQTRIDESGFYYRFFPIKPSWTHVALDEIETYSLEKRFKLMDAGGIGRHRNLLKKQVSYKIWGGKHIAIRMRSGKRLLIGTRNLDGLEWAMKKLMGKSR